MEALLLFLGGVAAGRLWRGRFRGLPICDSCGKDVDDLSRCYHDSEVIYSCDRCES